MTEFSFESIFQGASTTDLLSAYFDPDHLATQDAVAQLGERTVVEHREDETQRICTWTVASLRQLPMFVRPFLDGGRLRYVEWMRWRKAADEIDLTIQPQVLGGRVQIAATYQLGQVADDRVRRRYKGTITANVAFLSGRIERGILAEIEKGMPSMFECTQKWLLARKGNTR